MIRLLTAVLLFASLNAAADDLRTFSDGQVIEADDFNHNFQKLEQDIADIPAGPQGERGPQGEQGLPGNDGADGVAAGLSCTTDQSIVYRNGAWVCSSPEIVNESDDTYPISRATCPGEKRVVSGGCSFYSSDNCVSLISRPELDLSGWYCQASRSGNITCEIRDVWAICQ